MLSNHNRKSHYIRVVEKKKKQSTETYLEQIRMIYKINFKGMILLI